jgi:hypothetical protein
MLNKKEIDSLPKGYFPNTVLRRKFGKKHGSVVKERFEIKNSKGELEMRDFNIIGNRFQRRFRLNNPLKPLPVQNKIKEFFTNKNTKKVEMGWLAKFMSFFTNLFSKKK